MISERTTAQPMTLLEITRKISNFLCKQAIHSTPQPSSHHCWEKAKGLVQHQYALTPLGWACALTETTLSEKPISEIDFDWLLASPHYADAPLSRLIGCGWFCGRRFALNAATLDPRWESEGIIDLVQEKHTETVHEKNSFVEDVQENTSISKMDCWNDFELQPFKPCNAKTEHKILSVLDVGTGSGCLLIELLLRYPNAIGWGIDISAQALNAAKQNAQHHGVSHRSYWIQSDGLSYFSDNRSFNSILNPQCLHTKKEISANPPLVFDIIVSNPPYIPTDFPLPLDVKNWDPVLALDGGVDGLDVYRAWIPPIMQKLAPGGVCVFEIGCDQGPAVWDLCQQSGAMHGGIENDSDGKNRYVWVKFSPVKSCG